LARIRSGRTTSPSTGGRRASGEAQTLAQRLPLGVPRSGRPLVLGEHALGQARREQRDLQRGGPDLRGEHRIALVRHGRGRASADRCGLDNLAGLCPGH